MAEENKKDTEPPKKEIAKCSICGKDIEEIFARPLHDLGPNYKTFAFHPTIFENEIVPVSA